MLNPNNHNQQESISKCHDLTQHSLFNTHIQQLFIVHIQQLFIVHVQQLFIVHIKQNETHKQREKENETLQERV